jgi:hypothetical protein
MGERQMLPRHTTRTEISDLAAMLASREQQRLVDRGTQMARIADPLSHSRHDERTAHDFILCLDVQKPPPSERRWATTATMTNAAPNAPGLLPFVLYQIAGLLAFAVLLPPNLLYRTLLHLVPSARPYPTWSLRRDLAIAGGRLYLACTKRFSLPRPEGKKAWQTSPLIERVVAPGTTTRMVEIPPVGDEWVVGVAAVAGEVVKREKVPGFWTVEKDWKGVDASALPREKVIMYIAGG